MFNGSSTDFLKKFVTVAAALNASPSVRDFLRQSIIGHIPTDTAPWLNLSKLNKPDFRKLPPETQIALLQWHYNGKMKLARESIDLGAHAVTCAEQLKVHY